MNTITININGQFISKSSKNAGAAGNSNAVDLKFIFDESWRGFGKRVLWRDSKGENLTSIILTPNVSGTLEYNSYIPQIATAFPGWCSFTVEGYYETNPEKINKSVSDTLFVDYSEKGAEINPITPTEAMQLQVEFEKLMPSVKELLKSTEERIENFCKEQSVWEKYDDEKLYKAGNKVVYKGCSYLCIKETIEVSPQNSDCWLLIADRGERGQKGNQGPIGIEGERGTTGIQGEKGDKGDKGEKGDKGDRGDSGTIVPANGFYTFSVDDNGDLWVHYPDSATAPEVHLSEGGELFLSVNENTTFNVGNVKGDKGDIPQKGTDYWTEEDKAEIKSYVENAILGGAW